MAKHSILICRFPYGGIENPKGVDWLIETTLKAKSDDRIGDIHKIAIDDTPITMTRNLAGKKALSLNTDLVLMIDNDMVPDLYPGAVPFWESSLQFLINHQGPAIVAAPYCGPPPNENVYIFKWKNYQSEQPDFEFALGQYTREEAAIMAGIQEVGALPTGLILMHTEVFRRLDPPWFDYEYTDKFCSEKASTEDVYFTRNASFDGIPVYCNWDSWAGHIKRKVVGKPQPLCVDQVRLQVKQAREKGRHSRERMVCLPGKKGV